MTTKQQRRAELAKAINLAILRGLEIRRPGTWKLIQSGYELLQIEGPDFDPGEGGPSYYFPAEQQQIENN